MTYRELITRIVTQAQRGGGVAEHANLDAQATAEAMIPAIFAAVGEQAAGDYRKRSLLRRDKTIAMTNGAGLIPDDVLVECLCDATLTDPIDLTKRYAWVQEFRDFIDDTLDIRLGYFNSPTENVLGQREPNTTYVIGSGFTGDMTLNIPCVPVIPAAADDPVVVEYGIAVDIVNIGAEMLRSALAQAAAATV